MEHSVKDIYEMHAIVSGHVQGVGFRALTRYFANGLGITGSVKNLLDGTVEINAHGSKKRLEEFIQKIKDEAPPGCVEEAVIEYFPIENPHEDFKILH